MPALIGLGVACVVLAGSTASYLWWRGHSAKLRREARQKRRHRRIGYQRAWTWLMRPRTPRLTDQRQQGAKGGSAANP